LRPRRPLRTLRAGRTGVALDAGVALVALRTLLALVEVKDEVTQRAGQMPAVDRAARDVAPVNASVPYVRTRQRLGAVCTADAAQKQGDDGSGHQPLALHGEFLLAGREAGPLDRWTGARIAGPTPLACPFLRNETGAPPGN